MKQAACNGVVSILDMDNPKREAALDAQMSSIAQIRTDRWSRINEVEHRHERDKAAEHGVLGGRDDDGGPQEREYRSGQRRDEVRRKFYSGHSV